MELKYKKEKPRNSGKKEALLSNIADDALF
jgi:hypothetical protein